MNWAWIICLGLGLLLFIISLALMVLWKVPTLIDEVSGRKAKRQIERMRALRSDTVDLGTMNTSDFYLTVENGGVYNGQAIKAEDFLRDSSNMSAMLEDPYAAVLKETGVAPNLKANLERRKHESDELSATEAFTEEDEKSLNIMHNHNIVLLTEQTSL